MLRFIITSLIAFMAAAPGCGSGPCGKLVEQYCENDVEGCANFWKAIGRDKARLGGGADKRCEAMLAGGPDNFMKYMDRAKIREAIDQLDKIFKGAVSYFQTPRANPRPGKKDQHLPCRFPKSVKCTPASDPCRGSDGERYDAKPSVWEHPTWAALSFQLNDPHRFQYCFYSRGTGSNAIFTAAAHADLDCDGEKSTFMRIGLGLASDSGECSVKGSTAFISENKTE